MLRSSVAHVGGIKSGLLNRDELEDYVKHRTKHGRKHAIMEEGVNSPVAHKSLHHYLGRKVTSARARA